MNAAASADLVSKMAHRMQHRGPDGHGVYVHENVAIAHQRLSFIDLEGGTQPLSNETSTVWITYNGELYNFKELREELLKSGHQFQTNSDTEVIVHAYEEWGVDCVRRFRGMFAFAIVDTEHRKVFLARDHIGIKPLYYTEQNKMVVFASELQAFRAVPGLKFDLDFSAIDKYLWLQYIPAPDTVFKQFKKMPPGHYVEFNWGESVPQPKRFWDVQFQADESMSEMDMLNHLDKLLRDSVEKHLVSDVPFGAFLSGGLDSSLIVSYMSEFLGEDLKTFSIGFKEVESNELDYAAQVAKTFKTQHHVEVLEADALGILPDLVKHYGEPFGDSSAVPTYFVSKMASSHVKMVLSGDGGDEAFAGYKTYMSYLKYEQVAQRSPFKNKLHGLASALAPHKFPPKDSVSQWLKYVKQFPLNWREQLWKPEYQYAVNKQLPELEYAYTKVKKAQVVSRLQYLDLHSYLPFDILTKVDIASMMNSLEVRTPLVDKDVWEFAAQIPPRYLINELNGEWSGKEPFKKLLSRKFDRSFVYREKMGFSLPLHKWFGEGGEYRSILESVVNDPDSHLSRFFTKKGIQIVLDSNNFRGMWMLLFLQFWLDDFFSQLSTDQKIA